jgi:predicted alpha/beta superfamily hydrolase
MSMSQASLLNGLIVAMLGCLLFAGVSRADDAPENEVRFMFIVAVPPETPKWAGVYISGNTVSLGNWKADGLKLTRVADGRYAGSALLPTGGTVEYKVTLGNWNQSERDITGKDIPNRLITVDSQLPRTEITVAAWATDAATKSEVQPKNTLSGTVKFHPDFKSDVLKNSRTVAVYLPPGYERDKSARYPVLYMHDGQNLFDAATSFAGEWGADETAERLIAGGKIEPLIIVGIYNNAQRMDEYSPDRDAKRNAGGRGADYARFVVDEVKPFIDRTYRTRPGRADTGIAGSSLGGLISLYACSKYPEVFSRCGIISPALMWNDASILDALEKNHGWMKGHRFWLDMGTAEGSQIDQFSEALKYTRRLARIFDSAGLKNNRDYHYVEVEKGEHNERAWSARFDKTLMFLYPTSSTTSGQ